MLSVTADTHVYISGLHFGGLPRRLLNLADQVIIQLDISEAIVNEVLRVLRNKFRYSPLALEEAEMTLTAITHRVYPTLNVDVIEADPADNRILECATAEGSSYIVTGDKRHVLSIGSYRGIPIVGVADFFQITQISEIP